MSHVRCFSLVVVVILVLHFFKLKFAVKSEIDFGVKVCHGKKQEIVYIDVKFLIGFVKRFSSTFQNYTLEQQRTC